MIRRVAAIFALLQGIGLTEVGYAGPLSVEVFAAGRGSYNVNNVLIIDAIWRDLPSQRETWIPRIGASAPRYSVVPEVLAASAFDLEGETIEILGPMQGDTEASTAVFVPITAGDLVFDQIHLRTDGLSGFQRAAWQPSLDRLALQSPTAAVAGHAKQAGARDSRALEFTRSYLERFEQALDGSDSAEEVAESMRRAFPDASELGDGTVLIGAAESAMRERARARSLFR